MTNTKIIAATFAAIAIIGGGVTFGPVYGTVETVPVKIESKERINDRYMIFAEGEVFENTDTFWFFKFNSSDVYAKAKPGTTCTAKVNGIRLPILSWYRNIIKVENCS